MAKGSLLFGSQKQSISWIQVDYRWMLLIGLVFLLGMVLRLYDLGAESYWIDEMSTVIESQQTVDQLMKSGRLDQPFGYYVPFHLWMQIFGTAEVSTRLFSVLAGMGSIVIIYLIGRELFGKVVGLISAFLMAVSQFQIYYSQIARFYSLFELTTLLSFLLLILALRNQMTIYFVLYAMFSMLMVYTHAHGMFILVAQNLFFILQIKRYRNLIVHWLMCQFLIILALLPYFYPILAGAGGLEGAAALNSGGTPVPSLWAPLRSMYLFIMPVRLDRSWSKILVTYAIAAVLFLTSAWIYAVWQRKRNMETMTQGLFASLQEIPAVESKILLLICWLLIPILFPFGLSLTIAPIYADRYTISASPAVYLLLGLGIFGVRRRVPIIISLVVLAIMIAPGLHYYYVKDVNEQWKEVAQYIEKTSTPDQMIVFAPNMGIGIQQKSFDWYYRGNLRECGVENQLKDSGMILEALKHCVPGQSGFWVIIPNYSSDPFVPYYRSFFLSHEQNILRRIQERQFVLISVYLFEWTKQ